MPFEELLNGLQPTPDAQYNYVPENVIQQQNQPTVDIPAMTAPSIDYGAIFGGDSAPSYTPQESDLRNEINASMAFGSEQPAQSVQPQSAYTPPEVQGVQPVPEMDQFTSPQQQVMDQAGDQSITNDSPLVGDIARHANRFAVGTFTGINALGAWLMGDQQQVKSLMDVFAGMDAEAAADKEKYTEGGKAVWDALEVGESLARDLLIGKGAGMATRLGITGILSRTVTGAPTLARATAVEGLLARLGETALGFGEVGAAKTWISSWGQQDDLERTGKAAESFLASSLMAKGFEKLSMLGAASPWYGRIAKQFLAQTATMTGVTTAEKTIGENFSSEEAREKALKNIREGNFSELIKLPTYREAIRDAIISSAFSLSSGYGSKGMTEKDIADTLKSYDTLYGRVSDTLVKLYDLKPTAEGGEGFVARKDIMHSLNRHTLPELGLIKRFYPDTGTKGDGIEGLKALDSAIASKEADYAEGLIKPYVDNEKAVQEYRNKAASGEASEGDLRMLDAGERALEEHRLRLGMEIMTRAKDPFTSSKTRDLYSAIFEDLQRAKLSNFAEMYDSLNAKIRDGGDYTPELQLIRDVYGLSEAGTINIVKESLGNRAFEKNARDYYPRELQSLYDILVERDTDHVLSSLQDGILQQNRKAKLGKDSKVSDIDPVTKSFTVETTLKNGNVLTEVYKGVNFLTNTHARIQVESSEASPAHGKHTVVDKEKRVSEIDINILPHTSLTDVHYTMYHERLGHFLRANNVITEEGMREVIKHADAISKDPREDVRKDFFKKIGMDAEDYYKQSDNERFAIGIQYLLAQRDYIMGNEVIGIKPSSFYKKVMGRVDDFVGSLGDALYGNERNADAVIRRITSRNMLRDVSKGLLTQDKTASPATVPVPSEAEYRNITNDRPFQVSVEATPSKSTEFGEWLEKQDYNIKKYYLDRTSLITGIKNNGGVIAKMLDLNPVHIHVGDGFWEGNVNPSMQLRLGSNIPTDKIKVFADAHGLLYNQDAVGWHRLIEPATVDTGDASLIRKADSTPLSAGEQKRIMKALDEEGFTGDYAVISEKEGGVFLYWGDEKAKAKFNTFLNEVAQDILWKDFKEYSAWRSENGLQEATSGATDYTSRIGEFGRSDITGYILDILRPQIEGQQRQLFELAKQRGEQLSPEDIAINQKAVKDSFTFKDHEPKLMEDTGFKEHLEEELRIKKWGEGLSKLSDILEDPSLERYIKNGINGLEISKQDFLSKFKSMKGLVGFEENVKYTQHFVDQIAVAAKLGMDNKDWWFKAGGFINDMFGNYHRADAYPNVNPSVFAGFVAATSMNKEVRPNVRIALSFMREYMKRPDVSPFEWEALGKVVEAVSELDSPKRADIARELEKQGIDPGISYNVGKSEIYNTYHVLEQARKLNEREITHEDLELGGEKISAMWQNLMGSTSKVCNDTWNSRLVGLLKYSLTPNKDRYKLDQHLSQGDSYTALSIAIANAAKKLGITPAETQSALWGFTKSILDLADSAGNRDKTMDQLIKETTVGELSKGFADLSKFALEGYERLVERNREKKDGTYEPDKAPRGIDTEGIADEIEALGLQSFFKKNFSKYEKELQPYAPDRSIAFLAGSGKADVKALEHIGKNFQSFVDERRRLSAEKLDAFPVDENGKVMKPVTFRYKEFLTKAKPDSVARLSAENMPNSDYLYIGRNSLTFREQLAKDKKHPYPELAFSSLIDRASRLEIEDASASFNVQKFVERETLAGEKTYEFAGKLKDILQHDRIYKEYADDKFRNNSPIGNIEVRILIDPNAKWEPHEVEGVRGTGGHQSYFRDDMSISRGEIDVYAPTLKEAKAVLLHEIQHAIQDREDFAIGGNKYMVSEIRHDIMEEIMSVMRTASPEFDKAYRDVNSKLSMKFTKDDALIELAGEAVKLDLVPLFKDYLRISNMKDIHKLYKTLSGELEATDVLMRSEMSAEERAAVPPMELAANAYASVKMDDYLNAISHDLGTADFKKSAFSPETRKAIAETIVKLDSEKIQDTIVEVALSGDEEKYQNKELQHRIHLLSSFIRSDMISGDGLINTEKVGALLDPSFLDKSVLGKGIDFEPEYSIRGMSLKKADDIINNMIDSLKMNDAIIPLYKGDSVMPIRQKPWLAVDAIPTLPTKDSPWYGWSPHNKFARFAPQDNPAIDMMECWMTYQKNLNNYRGWAKDILKGVEDASGEVIKAIKPLFDKHQDTISYWNEYENGLADVEKTIRGLSITDKVSKYNLTELAKLSDELNYIKANQWDLFANPRDFAEAVTKTNNKINTMFKKIQKLSTVPEYQQLMDLYRQKSDIIAHQNRLMHPLSEMAKEHKLIIENLAKKHEDVRLYLEAETGNGAIADYMKYSRDRLSELGIPVLKGAGYMPRMFRDLLSDPMSNFLFDGIQSLTGVKWAASKGIFTSSQVPAILKFMSRVPNSVSWIPSAHAALKAYIPVAEKKMAYQPFLNRWARMSASMERQTPKMKMYFDKFVQKNLHQDPISAMGHVTNSFVNFEYARLIGFSTKVGFKHLLKLANSPAMYGFIPTAYGLGKVATLPVQALARKLGIQGEYKNLNLYRSYVTNAAIVRTLDENPYLSKGQLLFKTIVGTPVNVVEMLDNGVSLFAGIMKASNQNLSLDKIRAGIWEGILDANFRGAHDAALWSKTPAGRLLGMFQQTPMKLMEFKLKMLSNMFDRNDSWDISKWSLKKDSFGSYYGAKVLRYMFIMGAAEMIARENDTSILEMFLHVPFTRDIIHAVKWGEGDLGTGYKLNIPKPAISPPVQMVARMADKGVVPGMKKHLSNSGMITTFGRIYAGTRPDRYTDNTAYLLGLPSLSAPAFSGGSPDQSWSDFLNELMYGKPQKQKGSTFKSSFGSRNNNTFRNSFRK